MCWNANTSTGAGIMARVSLQGFTELDEMFGKLGDVPFEVTRQALDAMAEVAEERVRASGEAMGVRDPNSAVHILDKITHTRPKQKQSGGYSDVTFGGKRRRGNTATRNAEIAFINEYGKEGQPARPFIRQAAEGGADAIAAPGERVIGDWFEGTFGK